MLSVSLNLCPHPIALPCTNHDSSITTHQETTYWGKYFLDISFKKEHQDSMWTYLLLLLFNYSDSGQSCSFIFKNIFEEGEKGLPHN